MQVTVEEIAKLVRDTRVEALNEAASIDLRLAGFVGCGDPGCLITTPRGVRMDGGCKCSGSMIRLAFSKAILNHMEDGSDRAVEG